MQICGIELTAIIPLSLMIAAIALLEIRDKYCLPDYGGHQPIREIEDLIAGQSKNLDILSHLFAMLGIITCIKTESPFALQVLIIWAISYGLRANYSLKKSWDMSLWDLTIKFMPLLISDIANDCWQKIVR